MDVERVGICGTDVQIHDGRIPVEYPRVLGHEIVGRVVVEGPRRLIALGTRVLVNPSVACGRCVQCRADRPNLCPRGALIGRDVDGGLAEQLVIDELQLHPIPEGISPTAAILLQVLGTCIHAVNGAGPVGPGPAAVIGLGVAGLLQMQLLRADGDRPVAGIGRSPEKRALAARLGASRVGDPSQAQGIVDELSDGGGAALVVEAVGTVATLAQAVHLCGPGGTIVAFGTIGGAATTERFPWYELYHKEIRLLFPRAALGRDYDAAIRLAAGRGIELEPLFTTSFPMREAGGAFELLATRSGVLKVAIDVAGSV